MKKEQEKLSEFEENKQSGEVSRRDFLVGAGTVVVGGAIGAGLLSSCDGGEKTVTTTVEKTKTVTTVLGDGATATVTETTSVGGGATVTETKTVTSTLSNGVEPWQEQWESFVAVTGTSTTDVCSIDVKNGKIIRIRPLHWEEEYPKEDLATNYMWELNYRGKTIKCPWKSSPCNFQLGYKKRVYSPNRILYPLKRVDWEPGGVNVNSQNRGISKFKRISWDEATEIVASEIKRVQEKYTPLTVLCTETGAHQEPKVVHKSGGCHGLLFRNIYGDEVGGYTYLWRNADSWEGWYWGAMHLWGAESTLGRMAYTEVDVFNNTDMLVFLGGDAETVTASESGAWVSTCYNFAEEIGLKIVHVDPYLNYSAAVHAHKWIPILPNRDDALLLAIIYIWLQEDTWDKEYVETHVAVVNGRSGMEYIKDYVLGEVDGQAKTPQWAAPLCGIPVWTIRALARAWASKRTSTGHSVGSSMARGPYSTEPARLECVCLGMQGLGKPGIYQSSIPRPTAGRARRPSATLATRALGIRRDPQNIPQHIGKVLFPKAILEASMENPISWWGCGGFMPRADQYIKYQYPIPAEKGGSEIHMIWSDKPCNIACWNNSFKWIEAYRSPKIECIVIEHMWMENDCLFADVVLPVNTICEEEDIGTGGQTQNLFIYKPPMVTPVGESKTDYEIAGEIAKKLEKYGGVYADAYNKYTGGKTVEEWMEYGFDNSGIADVTSWDEVKEKKFWMAPKSEKWDAQSTPSCSGFYTDPDKNPLQTPTGKLEFYSEALAEQWPDDNERPPYPQFIPGGSGWTHDESLLGERAQKYPLLVVSNHPRWRHHCTEDDNPWLREIPTCKIKGSDGYMYEPCWLHPTTAAERGIKHGDIIKMYNERGTVLFGALVTERVKPGIALGDHGPRHDHIALGPDEWIDRGGNDNDICPLNQLSKNCVGEATSGYLVEVAKLDKDEMSKWQEKYPEAFARAIDHNQYDATYGLKFNAWLEGGA